MNLSKLEARHESFPYSEMFWSVFSRIRAEYGDCQNKSPYDKIRTRKNPNTNNFIRDQIKGNTVVKS